MPKGGVKIQWAGVAELKRNFEQVGLAINDKDPALKQIILKPSQVTVQHMQALAPVKTGNLRDAIIATVGPANQRGVFIVCKKRKAPYAIYVEFGTSRTPAHPFFRPAMFQMATTYVPDIAPDVTAYIAAAAQKGAYHPPG